MGRVSSAKGVFIEVSQRPRTILGSLGRSPIGTPSWFVTEEKTEAAKVVKPSLDEPKALDVNVRGGNIQGLASMAGQELV